MGSIQVIELDSPDLKSRGQAYGETARNQIEELIEIYREIILKYTGTPWNTIESMIEPYVAATKNFIPEVLDEITGIAEGAGRSFNDIFVLNSRSELLWDLNLFAGECSSLAALPGFTYKNSTLLAQNWDYFKLVEPYQVILKIHQRESIPPIVTFTEAGQLSKIGLNGIGIGLVVNNLMANQSTIGVPWILITRKILESNCLCQAMGYVQVTPQAHSMNFLMAHKDGEAIDIETSSVENHIIYPERNFYVHTNHYLEPCQGFKDMKTLNPNTSTYDRYYRLQKKLGQMNGKVDVKILQDILRDHFNNHFSICVHDSDEFFPSMPILKTCLSIVMDLSLKRVSYTIGNPCEKEYEILDVSTFLNQYDHLK